MAVTISGDTGISAVQAGAVESGDLPAGSVIQVVENSTSTEVSTNASGTFDTGLSGAITPTSVDSKILIQANSMIRLDGSDPRVEFFITDSADNILRDFGRVVRHQIDFNGTLETVISLSHVDTPATTSFVEYKVRAQISSGSSLTGGAITFQDNSQGTGTSTITLMEIAG